MCIRDSLIPNLLHAINAIRHNKHNKMCIRDSVLYMSIKTYLQVYTSSSFVRFLVRNNLWYCLYTVQTIKYFRYAKETLLRSRKMYVSIDMSLIISMYMANLQRKLVRNVYMTQQTEKRIGYNKR